MSAQRSVIRYAASVHAQASGESSLALEEAPKKEAQKIILTQKETATPLHEAVFFAELNEQIFTLKPGFYPYQWRVLIPQQDGSVRWESAYARRDAVVPEQWQIWIQGQVHTMEVSSSLLKPEKSKGLSRASLRPVVESPMPGRILKVLLTENQAVEANQPAVVMTSMKMELTLVTPVAGVVKSLLCVTDQLVDAHEVLVELMPQE
ncbi:MAG: acetyl-CoA carboxylase biotin carboxyl carrier protein subunit [Vampirovibrionales bacterium]|nr:acetyl-CoA carboxylase biotin carboxyl carrier protein subunit [Vampirovibrionales bacterium]